MKKITQNLERGMIGENGNMSVVELNQDWEWILVENRWVQAFEPGKYPPHISNKEGVMDL